MNNKTIIAIEGPDCIGKDYLIEKLKPKLNNVLYYREPGATPVGEAIREILLDNKYEGEMDAKTELLLYSASRSNLIRSLIKNGDTDFIILNRFYHSTFVYQPIFNEDLTEADVLDITKFATGGLTPDLTIVLYTSDFSILEDRIKNKKDKDRLENKDIDLYRLINKKYENIWNNKYIKEHGDEEFLMIDVAELDIDKIVYIIMNKINEITGNSNHIL